MRLADVTGLLTTSTHSVTLKAETPGKEAVASRKIVDERGIFIVEVVVSVDSKDLGQPFGFD